MTNRQSLLSLGIAIQLIFVIFGAVAEAAELEKSHFIYLSFEEGKGDTTKDLGKNKSVVTMSKGVTWTKNGKFGNAVEFGGASDYVEVLADVPENDFTMKLWLKTDVATQGVCSVLDGAAGAGGHDRHFFIVNGNISFRVWQGGGWNTTTKVSDGQWHHIALVVKKGDGQKAYVDGKEIGKHAYDHSDFNWQKRVWVGFSNDAAPNYFKGIIDEFVYYDKPLTPDEVQLSMKSATDVSPIGKLAAMWSIIKTR